MDSPDVALDTRGPGFDAAWSAIAAVPESISATTSIAARLSGRVTGAEAGAIIDSIAFVLGSGPVRVRQRYAGKQMIYKTESPGLQRPKGVNPGVLPNNHGVGMAGIDHRLALASGQTDDPPQGAGTVLAPSTELSEVL